VQENLEGHTLLAGPVEERGDDHEMTRGRDRNELGETLNRPQDGRLENVQQAAA